MIVSTLTLLAALATPPALPPAVPSSNTPDGQLEKHIDEDDQVRIEETRFRGESQRIVVKPKGGKGREYEVVPSTGAYDPSQRQRKPAGTIFWRLFDF